MPNPFIVPLNAVRAIEIVARQGSLREAADELGVTPGAVSQHIRRAEQRLGLELFERTPQGLVPTETLRPVLPQLRDGFGALKAGMAMLQGTADHVLTVSVGSVFASRWLVWRLSRFAALHPEIEVRMAVSGHVVDLPHSDIDCAIRFGRGAWPGCRAERVMPGRFRPVAAPAIAAVLREPGDLGKVPVIRDTTTMLAWSEWFSAAGLAPDFATHGPVYDDPALAFDASISGLGVLMAVDGMAAGAVRDGRLVRPFDIAVDTPLGYWLVVADARREPRKTRLFREWLEAEAAG